jgi:Ca2+-binding EF-hand superfamily protein
MLGEAFNYYDSDKDGKLTVDELKMLLDVLDTKLPDHKASVAVDGIDLKTFLEALSWRAKGTATVEQLTDAFKAFDPQNSGSVSVETLRKVLRELGLFFYFLFFILVF